jgi:hypothetical protein
VAAPEFLGCRLRGGDDEQCARQSELAQLIEMKGYGSAEELLEAVLSNAVSPVICMNEACNSTCEKDRERSRRFCCRPSL